MESKHYHSVSHHYSTKMMRTSLAVGVIWAVASLCLAVIVGLVFIQVPNNKIFRKTSLWNFFFNLL